MRAGMIFGTTFGRPPKNLEGKNVKNSARLLTTFDFDLQIYPERIDRTNIGKANHQPQPLRRWAKSWKSQCTAR